MPSPWLPAEAVDHARARPGARERRERAAHLERARGLQRLELRCTSGPSAGAGTSGVGASRPATTAAAASRAAGVGGATVARHGGGQRARASRRGPTSATASRASRDAPCQRKKPWIAPS